MRKKADTNLPDQIIKDLYKEHFALGEIRVGAWEAWLVIVLAVGMFFGTTTYVSSLPEFVLDCEYSSGACGGLWTHTAVHGQIGNVFGLVNETWAMSSDQLANAIGVMPGFSLFMLGFVSSALIFGLIWDKFNIVEKKKSRKVKIARSRGFISSEFIGMFFLTVLMVMIVSTPVTPSGREVSANTPDNSFSLASIIGIDPFTAVANASVAEPVTIKSETVSFPSAVEKVLSDVRTNDRRWVSSESGILSLQISNASRIEEIRKNGNEIWNSENHTGSALRMEFLISSGDILDFETMDGSAFKLDIDVNSIPLGAI